MAKKKPKRYTLIGMSGVGKSSIGKELSDRLKTTFIDTDKEIENIIKQPITHYISEYSEIEFIKKENEIVCKLVIPETCVIATGGSLIYSKEAMTHLKKRTTIIYLKDPLEKIQNRTKDLKNRGIVSPTRTSIESIYEERIPLYMSYADKTFNIPSTFHLSKIVTKIIETII